LGRPREQAQYGQHNAGKNERNSGAHLVTDLNTEGTENTQGFRCFARFAER